MKYTAVSPAALLPAALLIAVLLIAAPASAQQQPRPPRPPRPTAMTLTSPAWKDGGMIPERNAQPGRDVSPPLAWDNVPDGAESFVLMVRDLNSVTAAGGDQFLHWMVWNIPKTARSLGEKQPQDAELPDGSRQISSSGPYYRGPAASVFGPAHHYVFELYALNVPTLDVPAVGQAPLATQAAVQSAMAGKILGKGVFTGIFRRN
jgi:Raf kinase inhibitor-like YbhB/YbcL family protein